MRAWRAAAATEGGLRAETLGQSSLSEHDSSYTNQETGAAGRRTEKNSPRARHGGGARVVTIVAIASLADLSPDDKQVACDAYSAEGRLEVHVQNLDGQGRVRVTDGSSPRWSPDGKRLAVAVRPQPDVPRQLLIVSAKGANAGVTARLSNGMGGFVSLSPDGKRLVFSNEYKIQIVDVDGVGPARLIAGQQSKNRYPDWSPDGQWIVFASDRESP